VSNQAVKQGFVEAICKTMMKVIDDGGFPENALIGFLTYSD